MLRTEYGIQMYSIRDMAKDDLHGALKAVAEMGYKYIEFAGFFGNEAEKVKSWLDELGLVCSGTHTGLDLLAPDKIDETVACHKAIGCDYIIVPSASIGNAEKINSTIEQLNTASKVLASHGIDLAYHNHSKEFLPNESGLVFENELLNRTGIDIEVDTFWAYNAGIDVIDFLNKNKSRIQVIHIKDGIPCDTENRNYAHCHDGVVGKSLGSGTAPVADVRSWAIENGVLQVVESEGLDPDGAQEVGRCIKYLRGLDR